MADSVGMVATLDEDTQKRIAVQNLNKISFLISPGGYSALASIKNAEESHFVKESLKVLLGPVREIAQYNVGRIPERGHEFSIEEIKESTRIAATISGTEDIKKLAEAGVNDFAVILGKTTHVAKQSQR